MQQTSPLMQAAPPPHEQLPVSQVSPALQTTPHPPQFDTSVSKSTHPLAPQQLSPAPQAAPQPPQ